MDEASSSSSQRPYIRLTSQLRNSTKDAGTAVRFRCEVIGTSPISFSWLKNNAPVEKSRRMKIRTKENSSRLVITDLDVLDSGFYQCIASNPAASVNSTSILRVHNVPNSILKKQKNPKPSVEEYEDYELMDRGRLPDDEDADLYRVSDSAAGDGYSPTSSGDRWLDGVKYRVGDCLLYRGEACRKYLSGRNVMMTTENREDMYDIDRSLRAAMLFISGSPSISQQCRDISQAVACFHMYKICDEITEEKRPLTICRKDCEKIQKDLCPAEFELAAQHEHVGDGPKALFPSCPSLPQTSQCIAILDPMSTSSETPRGHLTHWCYVNTGTTYEGAISTTISGKSCNSWSDSSSREFNVHRYPELRNSINYCRNPGGKKTKPWCYTKPLAQEEYCDIPQCPKEMYPHLKDDPRYNSSGGGYIGELWESLSSQWQLAVIGGVVGMSLLLLLLICCACCCRSKQKQKSRSPQNTNVSQPPSIINSAANSTYYRKINGTSTPIMGRGPPMEMASLLPNQLGPPPYGDQVRGIPTAVHEEPYHIMEIPGVQLKIYEPLGEGQFGVIHRGQWIGGLISGDTLDVAIKSVRVDSTAAERASLEDEVRTVAVFDHPHVIKLLGVCYLEGNRLSAVFEYMVHGDLHDFLNIRAPGDDIDRSPDNTDFLSIAAQISHGMEYLASMQFVHRDLATRNCLVGDNRVIKIADFGLMRACYDSDYYKMLHRSWMPVRWMSKEAVEHGRFSEASDVWAFGVTLWEIWSYGRQPYEGYTSQQVIELIANRSLLECPSACPPYIYSLMVECWGQKEERRPTFSELYQRLQGWVMASPAHSILNPPRNSASSQSSSNSGRLQPKLTSRPYPGANRTGRRMEDSSPLMPLSRREANYAYSEDGDSD